MATGAIVNRCQGLNCGAKMSPAQEKYVSHGRTGQVGCTDLARHMKTRALHTISYHTISADHICYLHTICAYHFLPYHTCRPCLLVT
jgi:hypothetical protein